ncbi:MAG: polysaccharide biosynthesis protein [Hydrogenophilales bacterium]|nr:polysaccharide biosynthesis protein [Hydrogenophilales bacterium]
MKLSRINPRTALAFMHDVVAAIAAWALAYLFRFNLELPSEHLYGMLRTLIWVVPVQALIFRQFGLYRGIWRYASLPDIQRIVFAVGTGSLVVAVTLFMFRVSVVVPRSVLLLDPILLVMFMGGSRLAYRGWKENRLYGLLSLQGEPVLVVGAGDAASNLVKELARSRQWRVVGLLDDDVKKHERLIQGVRILGRIDQLPEFAHELNVSNVILAMPSANHAARRRVVDLCGEAGVKPLTVPAFDDLMSGKVTVSEIRNVELDDLLGREPVQLDDAGMHKLLTDRVVMVTGAGGSIGAELCRQISRFKPSVLLLFEQSEFAMYAIEQEFHEHVPGLTVRCLIGDVKDVFRVRQVMSEWKPAVVFHAAAYKHVPLMENANAWEAVRNNVFGTYVVASAAREAGVDEFVLISTDKAVNPTNVMGATKRLAEMVCQSVQADTCTRFVMVRFGNVLGSTGSVIPKFREQIARGGPVTVTHPEITRYFMSIPEAAQLVMQAGLMGKGGEIMVLDMGEPVKITDLARDMIRLSGYSEDDIKIEFTGLRPGEKLYEELLADDEHTLPTPHPKLRIARARLVEGKWLEQMLGWVNTDQARTEHEVKAQLRAWVPEYQPAS